MLIFIFFVDEAEIEKLKAAVIKAVSENNFSKAKEIQQKIAKILMDKTQASTNQNNSQGEKDDINFLYPQLFDTHNNDQM